VLTGRFWRSEQYNAGHVTVWATAKVSPIVLSFERAFEGSGLARLLKTGFQQEKVQ
jgi:hypothetical protein